ncbi:MAG: Helix-turn-helix domain [Actinomycetota bacterium]|jgi:transcriptional regulator with XRE-family HTH domain|nr:Helix-turn-helix domain [Actinomycetota bacterium]
MTRKIGLPSAPGGGAKDTTQREPPRQGEPEEELEPVDPELAQLQRRYESVRERLERQEKSRERKARRERYQREMGVGYLIYVARRYRRLSQAELARRIRTARSVIPRWESGGRLPSLLTLERIAAETDLELLIGLRDPEDRNGDLLALGIAFEEGNLTELLMLIDKNNDQLRVTPWRKRMVEEEPHLADVLL